MDICCGHKLWTYYPMAVKYSLLLSVELPVMQIGMA